MPGIRDYGGGNPFPFPLPTDAFVVDRIGVGTGFIEWADLSPLTPGTYGDSTHVAQIVVGAEGQISSITDVAISAGGSGTVTSVAASGGTTGMSFTGGPITGAGTLTLTGTLDAANGGTGLGTLTAYGVLLGAGTSAVAFASPGTAGLPLISNGAAANPTFQVQFPRIGTVVSASTITPPAATVDQYNVTALAVSATIAIPSGSPTDGQKLILRIKDNGSSQTLTWTTSAGGYRVQDATLPVATTISTPAYIGCIYNAQDSYWDVVAVA